MQPLLQRFPDSSTFRRASARRRRRFARVHGVVHRTGHDAAEQLHGLDALWRVTLGDPKVVVAVIDGPVDRSHRCFRDAALDISALSGVDSCDPGRASCRHGTEVSSLIFAGHHCGPVRGVAPRCRGLLVPIFRDDPASAEQVRAASQVDLALALDAAREQGADIINVSAGQPFVAGRPHPRLVAAVQRCVQSGRLIVAAAGNEGCDCLQLPAALPGVLVVGALNFGGAPAAFNNFGTAYRGRGILAPGEDLGVATSGGGFAVRSGTSYATPLVSGVAALLLSLYRRREGHHGEAGGLHVGNLLLNGATPCPLDDEAECRRYLVGTLNIDRAFALLTQGEPHMSTHTALSHDSDVQHSDGSPDGQRLDSAQPPIDLSVSTPAQTDAHAEGGGVRPSARAEARDLNGPAVGRIGHAQASALGTTMSSPPQGAAGQAGLKPSCGCGPGGAGDLSQAQLVYALGTLSYDFGTQARYDSLSTEMGVALPGIGPIVPVTDTLTLVNHLRANPHVASSIIWTLVVDSTPIYAIRPCGPFAERVYDRLVQFLADQIDPEQLAERVSIPGLLGGSTTLLMGQTVPVIVPELRGMFNWTTRTLVDAVAGAPPETTAAQAQRDEYDRRRAGVTNFLQRVYYELRNLGMDPRHRALNFAATNAFNVQRIFGTAAGGGLQLDQIEVDRSPICRADSDCWDVVLYFFNPVNVLGEARRVFRFTVDVSDLVPVLIGDIREWSVR